MGGDIEQPTATDPVVAIYRVALPQVYGYLLPRCGSTSIAEDLVSETFLAAISASRQGRLTEVNVAWLVGVARHKLVDYWRRLEREQRGLAAVEPSIAAVDDPWDEWLDTEAAYAALARLPIPQRAALTLRYLDGLPVANVAEHLGRSVHATETLLVRSRAALRRLYGERDRDAS
ncbi:MAG TPA: RNA polymerase sigma factor [Chloroflexota bacterium]|jgi:RNA polymerase sigma-70 factor (ECF subfamily)